MGLIENMFKQRVKNYLDIQKSEELISNNFKIYWIYVKTSKKPTKRTHPSPPQKKKQPKIPQHPTV